MLFFFSGEITKEVSREIQAFKQCSKPWLVVLYSRMLLPTYMGIVVSQYKDPGTRINQYFMVHLIHKGLVLNIAQL